VRIKKDNLLVSEMKQLQEIFNYEAIWCSYDVLNSSVVILYLDSAAKGYHQCMHVQVLCSDSKGVS